MTEREAAGRLLARLPDSEMEIVAGFFAWRACLADIDEWGDLRALDGGEGVLRDLDEAERAEFGETLWESWRRLEREGKIDPKPPPPSEPPPDADERARERRGYAEWWIEHLPDSDIAVVIAFLAWRARHTFRRRSAPAARMAAAGADGRRRGGGDATTRGDRAQATRRPAREDPGARTRGAGVGGPPSPDTSRPPARRLRRRAGGA